MYPPNHLSPFQYKYWCWMSTKQSSHFTLNFCFRSHNFNQINIHNSIGIWCEFFHFTTLNNRFPDLIPSQHNKSFSYRSIIQKLHLPYIAGSHEQRSCMVSARDAYLRSNWLGVFPIDNPTLTLSKFVNKEYCKNITAIVLMLIRRIRQNLDE